MSAGVLILREGTRYEKVQFLRSPNQLEVPSAKPIAMYAQFPVKRSAPVLSTRTRPAAETASVPLCDTVHLHQ